MTITTHHFNWVKLVLGLWIFVSPWILGFAGYPLALWSNILSGAFVVVLMLWTIFGQKQTDIKKSNKVI